MALEKCKECEAEVSTKAKKCPNCGIEYPTKTKSSKSFGCLFPSLIIIGLIIWLSIGNDGALSGADGFATANLNVRSGPSQDNSIIATLTEGEQVEFMSDSLGWNNIRLIERDEEITGWASAQFLRNISEYDSYKESKSSTNNYSGETERERKIKSQFSAWDGSHINLEEYIKNNMNDPNSYEHVETAYSDQGSYLRVRTIFRGKNAFGGIVTNSVRAKVSIEGNIIEILD